MIDATTTLNDAASRRWDAVVVGAGPAGSVVAHGLARRNRRVLLVDRAAFPRSKVCGACLNGRSVAALAGAGLGGLLDPAGAIPIRKFCWAAGSGRAELPLEGGVALSRETLDAELIRAAIRQGADFLPETSVKPLAGGEASAPTVVAGSAAKGEVQLRASVVVAADGLGGGFHARVPELGCSLAADSLIGAGARAENPSGRFDPGVIYMATGKHGYVGAVVVEDGSLNAAAAVSASAVRSAGGLGPLTDSILESAGFPTLEGCGADWRGTPLLTRRLKRVALERFFVVGDAAGYVEPFTGEGMAWAVTGAGALAPIVDSAVDGWTGGHAEAWEREHRRLVRSRQWTCRGLAALLRRPRLARTVVALLKRLPIVARPFVARLGTPMTSAK